MTDNLTQPAVDQSEFRTAPFSVWDLWLGLIPLFAVAPWLFAQAWTLWRGTETRLSLLVWLALLVIIGWQVRGAQPDNALRKYACVAIFLLGVIFYTIGVIYWSVTWVHVAAALFLVAWGFGRCGQCTWPNVAGWGLLFCLTIPLPSGYDRVLTENAAEAASMTLDNHGILHWMENGVIGLDGLSFSAMTVTSPRLGWQTLMATAGLLCWSLGRSFLHSLLLVATAPLWVLLGRYAVILAVAYGYQQHQADWTEGQIRWWLSLGAFAISVLLMLLADLLLAWLTRPSPTTNREASALFFLLNRMLWWPKPEVVTAAIPTDPDEFREFQLVQQYIAKKKMITVPLPPQAAQVMKFTVWSAVGLMLIGSAVAGVGMLRSGIVTPQQIAPKLQLSQLLPIINADALPEQTGDFRRTGFDFPGLEPEQIATSDDPQQPARDVQNRVYLSARWLYQWQGLVVIVDLSGPHLSWQPPFSELEIQQSSIKQELVPWLDSEQSWDYFKAQQTNPLGGEFYTLQSGMTDGLLPAELTDQTDRSSWAIVEKLRPPEQRSEDLYYEIRVSCESGEPLNQNRLMKLTEFFHQVRQSLRTRLSPGLLQGATGRPQST